MPKPKRLPDEAQQQLLHAVRMHLVERTQLPRLHKLLNQHHYLGSLKPVGERLYYVATDAAGRWLAILVFSAAANHLRAREAWIGWSNEQRRRRLSLITNNCRFLLLPGCAVPNLGSRVLRLTLDRLSADWQAHYGHPILAVETFVDPDQFQGTVYTANGWIELGKTDGWGRHRRDYYVKHDQPKRLFVRALSRQACRSLQAEHLQPALAVVEARVPVRCPKPVIGASISCATRLTCVSFAAIAPTSNVWSRTPASETEMVPPSALGLLLATLIASFPETWYIPPDVKMTNCVRVPPFSDDPSLLPGFRRNALLPMNGTTVAVIVGSAPTSGVKVQPVRSPELNPGFDRSSTAWILSDTSKTATRQTPDKFKKRRIKRREAGIGFDMRTSICRRKALAAGFNFQINRSGDGQQVIKR